MAHGGRGPRPDEGPEPQRTEPVWCEHVRAAAAGDAARFRLLLERFGSAAHAVALAIAGHQESEDVMQDVCLIAWERLPELREPERFGPWLASIARNRARAALRRRAGRPRSLEGVAAGPREPQVLDDDALAARELLDELEQVPEAFRELLAMRLVEGLEPAEIAEATGRSPGAVRVALSRGMDALRARLERAGWKT